jgi:hypothetical protein
VVISKFVTYLFGQQVNKLLSKPVDQLVSELVS